VQGLVLIEGGEFVSDKTRLARISAPIKRGDTTIAVTGL